MSNLDPSSQHVAILLAAVGDETAQAILRGMEGDAAGTIEDQLVQFKNRPPSEQQIDEVLDEFQRLLEAVSESELFQGVDPKADTEADEPVAKQLSGDPLTDLQLLEDYQ